MIPAEEERSILDAAYVPEHIVGLMTAVSNGEPLLIDGYLCFAAGDWVILVGYPSAPGLLNPADRAGHRPDREAVPAGASLVHRPGPAAVCGALLPRPTERLLLHA